jgi:galactose-1-phosphate uridylyltransferase
MSASKTHLTFDSNIGQTKPESIVNTHAICPFCCREELQDVIASEGAILLIKNKYPVLVDAFQTVIIETDECNGELSTYTKEHLYKVIAFGITKWQEMIQSGEFTSVIFYKNHGPCSGGTIRHPHMQIVGLKNIDYTHNIGEESFHGIIIHQQSGVELNLAIKPKNGFFEFNVRIKDLKNINQMADYIQIIAYYLLNQFHKACKSYNLFFYQLDGQILAKIVPRFITSPLFIGYSIPQVSNRAEEVVQEIQELYFKRE